MTPVTPLEAFRARERVYAALTAGRPRDVPVDELNLHFDYGNLARPPVPGFIARLRRGQCRHEWVVVASHQYRQCRRCLDVSRGRW